MVVFSGSTLLFTLILFMLLIFIISFFNTVYFHGLGPLPCGATLEYEHLYSVLWHASRSETHVNLFRHVIFRPCICNFAKFCNFTSHHNFSIALYCRHVNRSAQVCVGARGLHLAPSTSGRLKHVYLPIVTPVQ